jgi:hypothetical protein
VEEEKKRRENKEIKKAMKREKNGEVVPKEEV